MLVLVQCVRVSSQDTLRCGLARLGINHSPSGLKKLLYPLSHTAQKAETFPKLRQLAIKTQCEILNEQHNLKTRIRKRGIYCISSIYTFELTLKRFAQVSETLLMNRMSDGHIPMATNQTWTGVF